MEEDEQKKTREMLKEKGKSQPLEWMYKGEKPELEDYLLGKRVDKHVEKDEEPKDDNGVGAIFDDRIKANIELDMKAKMREDPLFAIKQKEEDVKRKLLQNPVKMKRLQKKIEEEQKKKMKASIAGQKETGDDDLLHKYLSILNKKGKDKGEKHRDHSEKGRNEHDSHKSEKHRKHSKNSNHRYNSDSDSSDEDRHKKYKKDFNRDDKVYRREEEYRGRKYDKERNGKRKSDTERIYEKERQRDSSPEIMSKHKKSKKHKHKYDSEQIERTDYRKHYHRVDSDISDSRDKRKYDGGMKDLKRGRVENFQNFKSKKSEGSNFEKSKRQESSDSSSESDDSEQKPKKQYGLIVKPGTVDSRGHKRSRSPQISKPSRANERSRSPRRHRSRSRSPKRGQSHNTKHRRNSTEQKPPKPRKLTDEEKKKKLERMMENAHWREEQRTKNVKHYEDEERKEEESLLKHGNKGANFLNPMMSSHADKSSLEDRIKRNKFNIQRTRADLNKDFLKK